MKLSTPGIVKWTSVGTVAQLAMVLSGHYVEAVALLFAPVGTTISLVFGAAYGLSAASGKADAAIGGAIVGGLCGLLGIIVSLLLGDVDTIVLAIGTSASTVAGLVGGLVLYITMGAKRAGAE